MNIHRNMLKIAAAVLLVAALPVGAQVLGGGIGGGLNGALNGGIGQGIHGDGGLMGGGSLDAPDVTSKAGKVRERAKQAGQRTKEVATDATGATRSKLEQARDSASGNAASSAAADRSGITTTTTAQTGVTAKKSDPAAAEPLAAQ